MAGGSPTVAQLRAFVAVSRWGRFSDAAAELGVSQPSLSQSLATLEANLGVRLLERGSRGALPTAQGQQLLALAESAVAAVDAVVEAAAPPRWLSGPLRLGIIPTIAPYLLPAALPALAAAAPDLSPVVREDQTVRLLEALRRGEIDLAVLALPLNEPGVVSMGLYDEDFLLAVPADDPAAGRCDFPLSGLAGRGLLLLDEGHCLRDQALEVCGQTGALEAGGGSARAASLHTIVQLVAAGLGSTLLPGTAAAIEGSDGRFGVAEFAPPRPVREVGLVMRAGSARAAEFEALARIVRDAVVAAGLPVRAVESVPIPT